MKKWTAVLLLAALTAALFAGCTWFHGYGTLITDISTEKSWDVYWNTMEGERHQQLTRKGEETLAYSIDAKAETLKVIVKQGALEKELPLEGTELSLHDFQNGKIQIIIQVTGGEKSELHFKLQ